MSATPAAPKDLPTLMEEASERGFTSHFQIDAKNFRSKQSGRDFPLGEVHVVETIRKDQQSTDPGDEATLYLLEAQDGEKGMLIIGNPADLSPDERDLLEQLDKG